MDKDVKYVIYIVTGIIALIFSLLTYISKKKSKILIIKSIADLFWALNYNFLGPQGYAGAIQHFTCVVGRDAVCYCREKNVKSFNNKVWFFLALSLYSLIPILTFDKVGWLFLLPLTGSVISLFSLYTKNALLTKILTIPAQSFCLAYSIIVNNIFAIIGFSLMILGAIIGLLNHLKNRK